MEEVGEEVGEGGSWGRPLGGSWEEVGDALYIYSFGMMVIGKNWWELVKCSHLRFSLAWVSQSVKRGETIV